MPMFAVQSNGLQLGGLSHFRDCLSRLRKVVRDSPDKALSLDDVKNEAWVIAETLSRKGLALDLTLPEDQSTMMKKLYGKFVMAMKTCIGFARSLDKGWDEQGEDALPTLGERVAADALSDPLRLLEHRELPHELQRACDESYSQATAYAVCLYQWSNYKSLAAYLCVKVDTLRGRVSFWGQWVAWQPSLFDRHERIQPDFTPLQGRDVLSPVFICLEGDQQAWVF